MAWCPHCSSDRPIQRQTYDEKCPFCTIGLVIGNSRFEHAQLCRGPAIGVLDVCSFCNSPVFAKAKNQEEYDQLEANETLMRQKIAEVKPCFVVTATMGEEHFIVEQLREFRREILSGNPCGRLFIKYYYRFGPIAAKSIEKSRALRLVSYLFIVLPSYLIARTVYLVRQKINRQQANKN